MTNEASVDVAVIGGGIIGLSTALTLHLAGRDTLLLDREEPASGCSRGNAGIIAVSEIFPLASLKRLIQAPAMLMDPLGPLAIRPAYLPRLAPWLLRFALTALPKRRRLSIDALAALNAQALDAYRPLLRACDASHMLIERGMLEVVRDAAALPALDHEADELAAEGLKVERVDAGTAAELEPLLAGRVAGGLFHSDTAHVTDPYLVAEAMAKRLRGGGMRIERAQVNAIEPVEGGCVVRTSGGAVRARQVVVTAGLWSKALLEPLGLSVPIDAERGYHLMLSDGQPVPSRPLSFRQESFVATPLASGLRLAGTVELAGAAAKPDWRRAERLLDMARRYLPGLSGEGAARWMGRRPSLPDSLPAIGRVGHVPQLLYAFGHQHLGLTQAAITGTCIAALAADRATPVDLRPFSLDRFGARQQRIAA